MDDRFASALAAAAASSANLGGSPNGNGQDIVNLQNLAQLQFRAGAAGNATGAFSASAKADADKKEAEQRAAAAAADAEQQKKDNYDKILAAYTDPKNFKQAINDAGGYDFYDPLGNKISVQAYSKATGKQIPDVLKNSKDQGDQKFLQDYDDLMDYGRALQGNEDSVNKFRNDKKYAGFLEKYKDKAYGDVVGDFKKAYNGYMQPLQLDTLQSKNEQGQDIRADTISTDGKANGFTDWLRGRQRANGVNYR